MRTLLAAAGIAAVALAATFATAQPPGGAASAQPGPAPATATPPAPHNLQFFPATIPHERLIQAMRGFTRALGVQCSFCHVRGDFASDANPHKVVARNMLRMTVRLNNEILPPIVGAAREARVTCFTCHRGQEEPATMPPPPAAPGTPPPPGHEQRPPDAHIAPDTPSRPQ